MIDTRAYAWCNLGPLADGTTTIAESHVQGSGVVTYRGTINLAGIYRPAPGTVVSLAYSDGQNWLARLPLRLRVLSSFANPLSGSRVTSISVGCDLAYFEDRKQPPTAFNETDENPDVPAIVRDTQTPRMTAAWIVGKILEQLGLTAAGTIPLTNRYLLSKFDMTSGYVAELGKLCASESYLARMNQAGQVEFIYKNPGIGASVLITEEDLIDLNPINSGELPGEAIYSRYSLPSLKPPAPSSEPESEKERQKRNWELDESISDVQQYIHSYTTYLNVPKLNPDGSQRYEQRVDAYGNKVQQCYVTSITGTTQTVTCYPVMDPVHETEAFERAQYIRYITRSTTRTNYDDNDRVTSRETTTFGLWGQESSETVFYYDYRPGKSALPPSGGIPGRSLGPVALRGARTPDEKEQVLVRETTTEYSALAPIKTSSGYNLDYYALRGSGAYLSSVRTVTYERDEQQGISKTVTESQAPYGTTPFGAESISRFRNSLNDSVATDADLAAIVAMHTRLVSYGGEVRIRTEREFGTQRRPPRSERLMEAYKNAPTVESVETIAWITGSATSQTAIELTPPYYSDYLISNNGTGYVLEFTDAPQKIRTYATTENRLLLGHRNGVGIQVLPELLPPAPMGLIYIRLNGCTGAFRVNGTTWNINPEGVTATTDALFWGAIDGSSVADAWFPLPPNASTLPAAAAVTVNASPKPTNAIAIPAGFNPASPDLAALFAALPTDAAPVFPKTITPGVYLKPWHETINLTAGIGGGAIVATQPWIVQPPTTLIAGMGAGGTATYLRFANLYAGMGAGATAQGMAFASLYAGMGAGATLANLGPVVNLCAGMGSGTTAERRLLLMAGAGAGAIINQAVAPDPLFSQVQLLLHCDGNFTDSSNAARTVANVGSVQFDATYSVANSSGYVPSGARKLSVNGGIDIPASTPATLEIWFRATSVADFGLFGDNLTGNGQLLAVINGQLTCFWNTLGTPELKGGTINANQAHRAAVTRDSSGIVRLFLDGTLVATAGAANNQAFRLVDILGAPFRGNFLGWFDEVRVTVGATGCRYVTSYTPSATPFPDA
jgi:hypothetical protein